MTTRRTIRGYATPPASGGLGEVTKKRAPTEPRLAKRQAAEASRELPQDQVPTQLPSEHAGSLPPDVLARQPAIEIDLIDEKGRLPRSNQHWAASEIWTRNRIYSLDASMLCIEVVDRGTQKSDPEHPFLGFRMAGGQRRTKGQMELSFPYPAPGSDAVFESAKPTGRVAFSRTSSVVRVVLRLRRITVEEQSAAPSWETLTAPRRSK